ncbi:MAG: (d)CMP kinase [Clostridia bacterium]|nr:(d)CMP kinase [Clostridia bacterium]
MISVAIDGPAGAGKSTISKIVAKELGFIYVDTGALYRAIGLYVLNKGLDTKSAEQVDSCLPEVKVELKFVEGVQHVFLNDVDVSDDIRTAPVSMAASNVSAIPKVREFLFNLQRSFAKTDNVVMDGRDIGTVVLPNADLKIFLTASPEDRAKRRYDEMIAKGQDVVFADVLEDLKQRDYNDSHREIAPLKPADDSVLVDTTGNTLEQSVELLVNTVRTKLKLK